MAGRLQWWFIPLALVAMSIGKKTANYVDGHREAAPWAYAQVASAYSSSSPYTRDIVKKSMNKGFLNYDDYNLIRRRIEIEHPQGWDMGRSEKNLPHAREALRTTISDIGA